MRFTGERPGGREPRRVSGALSHPLRVEGKMMMLYKLAGHDPVPVENVEEWASVFEGDRRIARDEFTTAEGETILVSTVFLAVDHGLGLESKPVLFETMVFGGPLNNKMW